MPIKPVRLELQDFRKALLEMMVFIAILFNIETLLGVVLKCLFILRQIISLS